MFVVQRLPTFLCFSTFLFLSIICVHATEIYSSEDQLPLTDDYKFHRRPAHGISDPGSPWITGPKNKKYQFHVGRQSWLAAREHCLGQNSDLVTISSQEELEWILGHYSPQFPNLKDRLIQIGLLIDTNYGTREWRWVNKSPLSHDILSWVTGEPFDHADGHERCALLRVNEKSIDDVDCDLPGSMTMMYRFVCERTHEEHVKHEEVNNPLWKKLQDILDFFGISGGQEESSSEKNATKSDETDEDYWEMSKKNATTPSNIEVNKNETEEVIVSSTISQASQNEDIEGSGVDVDDDKNEKTNISSSSNAPPQAQAAKTLDKSLISDELLLNENLAKINEKSAEIEATTSTGDVVLLETASIETTRTTKADPLEKISANKDKQHLENAYVDVLERNMEKLEKIVSAVEKMIDPMEDDLEEPTLPKPKIVKEGIVKKENKHKQEELKPPLENQENKIIDDGQTSNTTKNDENEDEKDTVDAMENDFDEAEHETQEHPNVNSGDLVVTPEHQENIELCENENEEVTEEEKAK
uniref:C-type lectin domain-containing protein n=1 Tax=Panagrolaimus superbus TaxID=310955 RepID=A0A914Z4Q7_9BILA